jgi:hypothetical protein
MTNLAPTANPKLRCTNRAIIIRNTALNTKFPGGTGRFISRYKACCNDHITVFCSKEMDVWRILQEIKATGMESKKDFITLDTFECEMWRLIHSEKAHHPFWLRTGADWLKCSHANGGVWVWYDEHGRQN